MKRSTDRILTTHVGSLIRPPALREFLAKKEAGAPFDRAAYAECLKESVAEVVRRQADIGLDVISDGEFGKAISWAQYPLFRLGGFARRPFKAGGNPFTRGADRTRFAEFYAELDSRDKVETVLDSVAVGPITYTGGAELGQDIDNFKAALRAVAVAEGFLPVAAPSSVIPDRKNEYYESDDDLQQAIGDAMHAEYKAIIDAGLLVQLDDARAAVSYDRMVPPRTLKDYRGWLARQVEVTNHAISGLPRDRIRYHVCWGSWPGPHSSGSSRYDPVGPSSTAMTHPLRSTGITPLQHYYGAVRPSPAHRYVRPRGWSRLCLFPWHRRPGSHVPYKSQIELRAASMPDAAWAVSGHPPN